MDSVLSGYLRKNGVAAIRNRSGLSKQSQRRQAMARANQIRKCEDLLMLKMRNEKRETEMCPYRRLHARKFPEPNQFDLQRKFPLMEPADIPGLSPMSKFGRLRIQKLNLHNLLFLDYDGTLVAPFNLKKLMRRSTRFERQRRHWDLMSHFQIQSKVVTSNEALNTKPF